MSSAEKQRLRKQLIGLRAGIPSGLRRLKSDTIGARLENHPAFRAAEIVAFTYPWNEEVDLLPVIRARIAQGKPVLLPRVAPDREMEFHEVAGSFDDLRPGIHGIPEPDPTVHPLVPAGEIELVVVPGVGFDPRGRRLGMGGGYFDRYLVRLREGALALGVAYDRQILETLPQDPWDVPVAQVLTERTTYRIQELEWESDSVNATHRLAGKIVLHLSAPCLLRLRGELGTGKTEWVRGFARALGWRGRVKSPSFTLENIYDCGDLGRVVHLDGYRLKEPSFLDLQRFDEVFTESDSFVLVEWPDRFGKAIDPFSPILHFERTGETKRRITWTAFEIRHHLPISADTRL